jgi:predicted protein tyrosine phosphatase
VTATSPSSLPRILFLCSLNRWRSPTAEQIFAGHPGIECASAGLNHGAENPLTPELVEWADLIFVMERQHKVKLSSEFKPWLRGKRVVCLNIPDHSLYGPGAGEAAAGQGQRLPASSGHALINESISRANSQVSAADCLDTRGRGFANKALIYPQRRYYPMLQGSCHCGSISFKLASLPTSPTACHCVQCRKQSGHYFASANVPKADVSIEGAEHLSWFQASEKVRRGFCARCGAWLFWEPVFRDWTSVALGAIDGPTGLALERHIFVAEKGDYYELMDGLPQNEH